MTPGPDIILRTPLYRLVKIETISSGNTFGAKYWSDGKFEALMLPDRPWLRKHPDTGELFWVDDCEEIAEELPFGEDRDYEDVPYAETPVLSELESELADRPPEDHERQLYLCLRCWWAANDSVRSGGVGNFPDAYRENLDQMLTLLDVSNPGHRLLAAEAARETGNFSKALELLVFDFPEKFELTRSTIYRLVMARDVLVRQIVSDKV